MLRTGKITKTLALLVYFPYLDQGKTSPFYSFCFLQSVRALCSMSSTTGNSFCFLHCVRTLCIYGQYHGKFILFSAQCEDILFSAQYHMKFSQYKNLTFFYAQDRENHENISAFGIFSVPRSGKDVTFLFILFSAECEGIMFYVQYHRICTV